MKNTFKILTALLFISLATTLKGQDAILLNTGEIIKCKVEAIGVSEIEYVLEGTTGPRISVSRDQVKTVDLGTGETIEITSNIKDPKNYAGQSKNNFKFGFLSPLMGYTRLGYERSLQPGRSIEVNLTLIGVGNDEMADNASGAGFDFGYKFMSLPTYNGKNLKYTNLFQGYYVKPTIMMSTYGSDYEYYDQITYQNKTMRYNTFAGAFILFIGKQWVFGDIFTMDFNIGAGYGGSSNNIPDAVKNGQYYFIEPPTNHRNFIQSPNSAFSFYSNFSVGLTL